MFKLLGNGRTLAVAVGLCAALAATGPGLRMPAAAQSSSSASQFTEAQRSAIESIIKDYLVKNPEVLLEAQNELEKRMEKIQAERQKLALKANAAELYRADGAPIAGDKNGDVTIVEFFDYNCGYCKRAFGDIAKLIDKDKKVRVVFKEFPILSKGSIEAAKAALAAGKQGKYWELHSALIAARGQVTGAVALRLAGQLGLNVEQLKKDMNGKDVQEEIDRVRELAEKMGIRGTPYFLVGDKVIGGAPDDLSDLLSKHVADVRKNGCSVC